MSVGDATRIKEVVDIIEFLEICLDDPSSVRVSYKHLHGYVGLSGMKKLLKSQLKAHRAELAELCRGIHEEVTVK